MKIGFDWRCRRANAHVRIHDRVAFVCHRQDQPFDRLDGELARNGCVCAIPGGHDGVVSRLLQYGAAADHADSFGKTLMLCAAGAGWTLGLVLLHEKGASLDAPDRFGRTPMHHAVESGSAKAVA